MPLFGLEPDLKDLVKDFDPLWSILDLEFFYASFSIMELKYIFIKVAKTSENAPSDLHFSAKATTCTSSICSFKERKLMLFGNKLRKRMERTNLPIFH